MGLVYTEITLKNATDDVQARNGTIKEEEVRQATVKALVDTGTYTLVINEELRERLGLDIFGPGYGTLANGTMGLYNRTGPLKITWKNRSIFFEALVIPNAKNVLLGALPLEALDLIINPNKEEVVGAHGEEMEYILC